MTPLFIDEHLLVLDKPAGLLAVPGRGPDKQDCLSARAQQRWPGALIVHRLDQATSGLVLMARHLDAQRRLGLAQDNAHAAHAVWFRVGEHIAIDQWPVADAAWRALTEAS